jgi:adenosine deaminase
MAKKSQEMIMEIKDHLTQIISETNGISLYDTLELLGHSRFMKKKPLASKLIHEFASLIHGLQTDDVDIDTILNHPVSHSLFQFFKEFPLHYHEEHIHLTGSLAAEFIYPRIKKLLAGKHGKVYKKKIVDVYGEDALPFNSVEDVDKLIRLKEGEQFKTYLKILYLAKLVLTDKKAHEDAAYHMAKELYSKYNVGKIRLKFTLSRSSSMDSEQIPGANELKEEDVVMGLYQGFKKFQKEYQAFDFILSPSFRKELDFYDKNKYDSKKSHFEDQVDSILKILEKHPELKPHLKEVDTVGDERELYRKKHFEQLREGLRKLQYQGFSIRSHHGETWKNLRKGVQSVDNAMNIWHIDTLEHGLSLGINPNFYFHRLFQNILDANERNEKIIPGSNEFFEVEDMNWHDEKIKDKLITGQRLSDDEITLFIKTKFHTAREIEHYQHDVLNRMINKQVSLIALPSSNLKLTGCFPYYRDHPFSWWEKKGVKLGVGTDNYITLSTNFIQEMLILLYSDPENLKITKLLMITTREKRRAYISQLLWKLRKDTVKKKEAL